MKVTKEKIENGEVFLTVEMEPAEIEESLEECYQRLVKTTHVPGFRKGKAPRAILERYISRDLFLEEALGDLIPKAYEKAVREQKLDAIARPRIEITQTDPVVFKAVVPLRPKVKLGDYLNIRVTPKPVKVTKNDINAIIERLRHQHATWEPVERPVGFNDQVVLDVVGSAEGRPFINQKGAQYLVVQNQPFPVPGFAEQLVGMKRDEEKEFQLQFPSDYPKSELAGKRASFKVRVGEIKEEKLPELNDELAKVIDPDSKTLDSLRKRISADLKRRVEDRARIDFEEKVIQAAVDTAEVEFPPILVEREIDRLLNQRIRRWQAAGSLEEYLKTINKTAEEIREELRPLATRRTTWSLVLGEIAKKEKIEVGDAEIDTEIEDIVRDTTEDKREEVKKLLTTPQSRQSIEQALLTRKTIERLAEIAKGSNTSRKKQEKEEQK